MTLPANEPGVAHDMVLGGPKPGYTWTINGQTYDPAEVYRCERANGYG